ncbi:MAG: formate acetyltransferase [Deltaproteobacteria bacterium]|nr:formate acetyltransferase [Deltaproteobacteria bacterium]
MSASSRRIEPSRRILGVHHEILSEKPALCVERALLVTRFFRDEADATEPMVVQKARALSAILRGKAVRIHPRELLVGSFTSHRVGGGLYPELHGVVVLEDLFALDRRSVNPFVVSDGDRWSLLTVVLPFWVTRVMALRGRRLPEALAFAARQLRPTFHVINESGGISHFVPDYEGLLGLGTEGYRRRIAERLAALPEDAPAVPLLVAMRIVCDALDAFAGGYLAEAERLLRAEADPERRSELESIVRACARVPRLPPRTLQEALQSLLFAQIALNLESLDNSVSPGRLDQILWPFYDGDRDRAFELVCSFALKLCEIVPVFSRRITRFHGGMFNGQVVVVGGQDERGEDATNELTFLFLEAMDRLRTRQPNYHARLHSKSPAAYRSRISAALAAGSVSPAVYNDEVIVPMLVARGIEPDDARDYATVGCVEPVAPGRSFLSTDAALCNLPLCLELALDEGRRFGARRRTGAATPPAEELRSVQDLLDAFRLQLEHALGVLFDDLAWVERANARWHPTPLTSMLVDGCMSSGLDATVGGARYNGSGIQGVGAVEVGDCLSAVEAVVFRDKRATMAEVVRACRRNFASDQTLRARLRSAPKYGNDDPRADGFVAEVMALFVRSLAGRCNARGGSYAAGFYSVTSHQAFGEMVGALPSGRGAGEPFSSGLSPASGMDTKGPTAALRSYAGLPLASAHNGVNFNLELAPWTGPAQAGEEWLRALIDGAFAAGAMQLQVNVLDPRVLLEARDNPGRFPGLLVRVSGYSAYFNDLSPAMKQEIIDRMVGLDAAVGCRPSC